MSDVLHAATREFARVGYDAFRVEDVAAMAGVNKTTVYRRWPTKADLVAAALRHSSFDVSFLPDTGALRGDLLGMLDALLVHTKDPIWRGLLRAMMVDVQSPELARLIAMFRAEYRERWARVVQRGIDRGELPRGTSAALVSEILTSVISIRKLRDDEPISLRVREALVDTVLAGARTGAAVLDGLATGWLVRTPGAKAVRGGKPQKAGLPNRPSTRASGAARTASARTKTSSKVGATKRNSRLQK